MATKHTSYRISDEGKRLIKLLTERLGVNATSVIELAVRELAEKKGISTDPQNTDQK